MHHYPYRIQVAQELSEEHDKMNQLQFRNQYLDLVNNCNTVNSLLMSDKAHFYIRFCE
jgi:hypothetical protein